MLPEKITRSKLKHGLPLTRQIQPNAIVKYARPTARKRRHKHPVGSGSDFGVRHGFGRHSRNSAWQRQEYQLPGRSVRWWKLGLRSKQGGAQVDDYRSDGE